jgi:hypothetical protein
MRSTWLGTTLETIKQTPFPTHSTTKENKKRVYIVLHSLKPRKLVTGPLITFLFCNFKPATAKIRNVPWISQKMNSQFIVTLSELPARTTIIGWVSWKRLEKGGGRRELESKGLFAFFNFFFPCINEWIHCEELKNKEQEGTCHHSRSGA